MALYSLGHGSRWAWRGRPVEVLCLCFQSCFAESAASWISTSSGGWKPFSTGRSHKKDASGSLVSCTSTLAGSRRLVGGGSGRAVLVAQRDVQHVYAHKPTCEHTLTHRNRLRPLEAKTLQNRRQSFWKVFFPSTCVNKSILQ